MRPGTEFRIGLESQFALVEAQGFLFLVRADADGCLHSEPDDGAGEHCEAHDLFDPGERYHQWWSVGSLIVLRLPYHVSCFLFKTHYARPFTADLSNYLVAIDAQIQSLVHVAQSQAEKTISGLFDSDIATPQLDQQVAVLQRSIADQQEQYRRGLSRRAGLKSERARLARQIIDQRQRVSVAQRKRDNEVTQTLAALDSVGFHAERMRKQRQELRLLQREVEKFDQDFSQLEGERFDNLREVEVLIESVGEDRDIDLEILPAIFTCFIRRESGKS